MNGYNTTITEGTKVVWLTGESALHCEVLSVATNGKARILCPSGGIANVTIDLLIHADEYEMAQAECDYCEGTGTLTKCRKCGVMYCQAHLGTGDTTICMFCEDAQREQAFERYANGLGSQEELRAAGLVDLTQFLERP
jgi:hypothetical protein